ncbi:GNAT family N-acetyltransferase [Microbulbifer sp. JMSA008]|uniref:GNAT family N-acetyltransferase n=1 Tax=Microbulbifer sp. JMSA008 TaxID=3243373 RepID=UPI0040394B12
MKKAGMFQITTPNLVISELCESDSKLMLNLLNDEDFVRYIGDRGVRTLEQASDYIKKGPIAMYRKYNFGLYKVELGNGIGIGICGLIKRDCLDDVDIGFAFLAKYRGRGYALEAAQAVLEYAQHQLNLERIVAITLPENTSSIKLLNKIGLQVEKNIVLPGETEELLLMAWEA